MTFDRKSPIIKRECIDLRRGDFMLAKVWKKALLAICILACLFNVMYKLVSRTSLEVQLKSVQNQSSLIELFKQDITPKNETNSQQKEITTENRQVDTTEVKQEKLDNKDTIVVIN